MELANYSTQIGQNRRDNFTRKFSYVVALRLLHHGYRRVLILKDNELEASLAKSVEHGGLLVWTPNREDKFKVSRFVGEIFKENYQQIMEAGDEGDRLIENEPQPQPRPTMELVDSHIEGVRVPAVVNYNEMTRDELRAYCREHRIAGYSSLNKAELIEALSSR